MRFGLHGLHGARIAYAPESGGGEGGGGQGGGEGGQQQQQQQAPAAIDWESGLDDTAKATATTRGWAGKQLSEVLPQVFKSYGELEGLVGTSIKIPGADAKPEDWAAFNAKLGVPDAADKYAIPKPASGDYSDADKAFQQSILPALHGAGLSQRQVDALVPAWNQLQAAQTEQLNQRADQLATASRAELTKAWGGEDGFKANIDLANRAFRATFGPDLQAAREIRLADGTMLADSPVWAKAFAELGRKMSEDGALPENDEEGGGGAGGSAKAQLDAIYAAARADPKHPYNNPKDPQHQAMQDKVMSLSLLQAGALP